MVTDTNEEQEWRCAACHAQDGDTHALHCDDAFNQLLHCICVGLTKK